MKKRYIVFLVFASIFTALLVAAAVFSCICANAVVNMRAADSESAAEAVGIAGGVFVFAVLGVISFVSSVALGIVALIFVVLALRAPVGWLRGVSAALLALDVASIVLAIVSLLRMTA